LPEELIASEEAGEDDANSPARQLIPFIRGTVAGMPEPFREALLLTEYEGLADSGRDRGAGLT
jgi:hypothetical protein